MMMTFRNFLMTTSRLRMEVSIFCTIKDRREREGGGVAMREGSERQLAREKR